MSATPPPAGDRVDTWADARADTRADTRADDAGDQPAEGSSEIVRRVAGELAVVPADPWRHVRVVAIAAYIVAYIGWFRRHGLIIDRISVMISIALVLVLAHLGRPVFRWRRLALDLALYSGMWLAYEETRGAADRLGMPLQVESVRNIDRVLFLGVDPTVWLQDRFYSAASVRWYDVVASVAYYTHFVVPVAVVVVLWIADRRGWVRLMRRFATVLMLACISFIVLPTAPPWMAAGGDRTIPLDALPPLARPAGRGWQYLGLDAFVHAWETGRDWVNRVAAMPSLHAALALMVVLFFFPLVRRRWVRVLLLAHPAVMGVSLVYLAEHYVVDVLAGWALVLGSFWFWDRTEQRWRARRAAAAREQVALPAIGGGAGRPLQRAVRRRVFVDESVVRAAADPTARHHEAAAAALDDLLEEYVSGHTSLVTDACTGESLTGGPWGAVVPVLDVTPVPWSVRRRARGLVARRPERGERRAIQLSVMTEARVTELASVPGIDDVTGPVADS